MILDKKSFQEKTARVNAIFMGPRAGAAGHGIQHGAAKVGAPLVGTEQLLHKQPTHPGGHQSVGAPVYSGRCGRGGVEGTG